MSDQKNDQALCQAIRKWKETAVDLVDDIAGWRACPGERFWHTPWRGLPGGFRSLTIQLTAETANFPGLDCAPVMAVYRAVEIWHADHDAGRLPEQSAITADLNAAMVALGVIEAAIENRTSDKHEVTEPPGPEVAVPEAPPTTKGQRHAKWLAEAMLLVRDNPKWSDAEIARRVGISPSALSRDPTYKLAAALAREPKVDSPRGYVTTDPETRLRDVEAYADGDKPPPSRR